jgi:hypothetical protein
MADDDAGEDAVTGEGPAWRVRPEGRNRWSLRRDGQPVAVLGVLGTEEWWVTPVGEGLPWAETYASRGAAVRAVVTWWLHTHPFGDA